MLTVANLGIFSCAHISLKPQRIIYKCIQMSNPPSLYMYKAIDNATDLAIHLG